MTEVEAPSIDDLLKQVPELLVRRINFQPARFKDKQTEDLRRRLTPINKPLLLKPDQEKQKSSSSSSSSSSTSGEKTVANGVNGSVVSEKKACEKFIEGLVHKPKSRLIAKEAVDALQPWSGVRRVGSGLNNLGNTCFLNSTLQCLTYTPPLANYFLEQRHKNSCNLIDKGIFCMVCLLERHVNQVFSNKSSSSSSSSSSSFQKKGQWGSSSSSSSHYSSSSSSSSGTISPILIVKNLSNIGHQFKFGYQEDAHEFLIALMEALQRSLLRLAAASSGLTSDPSILRAKSMTPRDDLRLSQLLGTGVAETSLIHSIFGGHLVSQLSCALCSHRSFKADPFLDLSLEIKSGTLEECFKAFCRSEVLGSHDQYTCDKCKRPSRASKQLSLLSAPNVLTVHLKRFNVFGQKIGKPILYPAVLNIAPFIHPRALDKTQEKSYKYHLYGVLVHQGHTADSGHYYSYVKSPAGVWYQMNDESVSQSSQQTALSQKSAYILFYSRDPSSISSPPPQPQAQHSPSPVSKLPTFQTQTQTQTQTHTVKVQTVTEVKKVVVPQVEEKKEKKKEKQESGIVSRTTDEMIKKTLSQTINKIIETHEASTFRATPSAGLSIPSKQAERLARFLSEEPEPGQKRPRDEKEDIDDESDESDESEEEEEEVPQPPKKKQKTKQETVPSSSTPVDSLEELHKRLQQISTEKVTSATTVASVKRAPTLHVQAPVEKWGDVKIDKKKEMLREALLNKQGEEATLNLKPRSAYDQEYDQGKLKKVRAKKASLFDQHEFERAQNPFQTYSAAGPDHQRHIRRKALAWRKNLRLQKQRELRHSSAKKRPTERQQF